MNAGVVITAVGTVLAAVATVLVGYFVKRTDNVAKMTRANMQDQEYVMRLVGSMRDDLWRLSDSWWSLRAVASKYRNQLITLNVKVTDVLPEDPPRMRHQEMERRHADGLPMDEDEKK